MLLWRKYLKSNFREIVRKNQRNKLVSTEKNEKIKLLYRNWNWHLEKKKIFKKLKRNSRSQSSKRKTVLEDWYIIPEVSEAKELIYNAHTSHGSHLKVDPTYKEVLKSWYRWDNMLYNIRDFYFKCQVCEISTSKLRKNAVIKHIDSFKSKDRYQTDTVQLSKYVMSDRFKYLFTMVDHFTKYGWIIPLNDKTAKNMLGAFKKCITTQNVPTTLQTDNGTEFKNSIMNQFWLEKNIQLFLELLKTHNIRVLLKCLIGQFKIS